ncbi:beta-glucanase [Limosilactobacillus sp. STM2_1]|uniref:Beta-glucanase n=1 Tax=Limosilactobacillus rudii TaxID=2759755 RepID=A0A7W3UM75_9LACO|nr:glycosyl hydrolase family 8 [Limosilactobacillus rudii]MBB1080019.1 beta-glucanase [Limosilactobacillus rudii]MBB1098152.1 beta-glucanase [Limosilactobacillus rudii]MCD7135224.1 glycosyl hydrolase family 8 [Limosilactobacillus rudii]
MKRPIYIWLLTILVVLLYTTTLIFIRIKNPEYIQHQAYNRWRSGYLITKNDSQAFVNTSNNKTKPIALSEAQGYGLQIVAYAGEKGWASQKDFEKLLNYYLAHRDYVNNHQTYLMSWRQTYDKQGKWVNDSNSATDGDLYIAAALHHAATIWPEQSAYYQKLECKIAADILRYEYNPTTQTLTVGDWVSKDSKYYYLLRTSDVMPEVFDDLYERSHDIQWQIVKDNMLDRLVALSNQHRTGLVPDFAWAYHNTTIAVKPRTVASAHDGDYGANACRVPMMLAQSNDPRAQKVLTKMMKFFSDQYYITAGYSLDGHRLVKYQSNSFSAPIFYAVSYNRNKGYDNLFASQKYIFSRPVTTKNYYDATLTTLAALGGIN